MKKTCSKSQQGIGLLQTLVIGAVVAAAGAFVMKTGQQQTKVSRTATQRIIQHNFRDQVSEALQSGAACMNTLRKAGTLSDQKLLTGIYHADDTIMYAPAQKVEGQQKISEIKLVEYESASGLKYHKKPVFILINTVAALDDAAKKSFGGQQKGHKIPIFLITRDNVVEMCTSDDSGAILTALREACIGFGGSFNEDTATCEKIHGQDGIVLKRITEKFCSTGNPGCPHPYAGQVCSGVDVRGNAHSNWVIGAFNGSGEKVCHCLPKNCANPALYCLNTDLGTDWCQLECPVGTKDVWTEWSPSPATVCNGEGFTQTQICTDPLGNLPRTRGATGTMTDGPGNCSYETTLPNGTVEAGSARVSSSGECDGMCAFGGRQNCNYQSDCGGNTCTDSTWSPDPSSMCAGTNFNQTSNCSNSRQATGTKTTGNCANCTESTWAPDPSTICEGEAFQQTSNCNNSRNAVGSKTSGSCAKCTDSTWTPDVSSECSDKKITQTSNCGKTREVSGGKDCSAKSCTIRTPVGWSQGSFLCTQWAPVGTEVIKSGESYFMSGGNGQTGLGMTSGTATYVCNDGVLELTGATCQQGEQF